MSWLKKLMPSRIRTEGGNKRSVPEGLWEKCDKCGSVLYRPELEENLEVCPKCGHHMPIRARARLASLFDPGLPTREIGAELGPTDVLKFKDQKKYSDRIKAAQKSTGERDAMITIAGKLKGRDLVAASFDFAYMGGSMGSVVGCVSTEMYGTPASRRRASAADVLAICISENRLSCMRAPPLAENDTKGQRSSSAVSAPRVKRSPTTEPIEPPM